MNNTNKAPFCSKAPRFPPILTEKTGPADYERETKSNFIYSLDRHPTSKFGLYSRKDQRFRNYIVDKTPGPTSYPKKGFVEETLSQRTSKLEQLSCYGRRKEFLSYYVNSFEGIPGPGTYYPSYAVGRIVSTDSKFSLSKGPQHIHKRDKELQKERDSLKEGLFISTRSLFSDIRTNRRISHLALYF